MRHKFLRWTHCGLLKEYLVGKIVSANFMSPPQLYCYFCFHVDFHVLGDYCCWHLLMLSGEDVAHLQKRRNNKKGCKCQTYLTTMQKKGLRILVQIHNVKCTVLSIVQWKRLIILFNAIFLSLEEWGHGRAIVKFDTTLYLSVSNRQFVWNNFSKDWSIKRNCIRISAF